ncbi:MAG: hypothetical protein AB8G05_23230 [Oligoflexales bacterium]
MIKSAKELSKSLNYRPVRVIYNVSISESAFYGPTTLDAVTDYDHLPGNLESKTDFDEKLKDRLLLVTLRVAV